jgi:hypothetical protein
MIGSRGDGAVVTSVRVGTWQLGDRAQVDHLTSLVVGLLREVWNPLPPGDLRR